MLFESKLSEIELTPNFRKVSSCPINLNDNKLLEKFPENYKNCRFILLDTETTGLDVNIDRLISINAVEMINNELTGIQFNAYLHKRFTNNTRPLMYYLSDYNYSRDNNIKKSLETFLSFVSDSIIITHNALFDMKFINEELKRCGLPQIPLGQCICTLKILKNLKKIGRLDKNFKLRLCDLCRYYDINIDPKDLHQGIVDAIVFARVVAKMLDDGIYNEDMLGICELISKKTRTGSFKGSTHELLKIIHYWFFDIDDDKRKKMIENFSVNDDCVKGMRLGEHYSRLYNSTKKDEKKLSHQIIHIIKEILDARKTIELKDLIKPGFNDCVSKGLEKYEAALKKKEEKEKKEKEEEIK